MNHNYFGIVLAPLVETISQARKTRELWAASYVFSRFMYHMLMVAETDYEILAPAFSEFNNRQGSIHGAGVWPDRCILHFNAEPPDIDVIVARAFSRDINGKQIGFSQDFLVKGQPYFQEVSELHQHFKVQSVSVELSDEKYERVAHQMGVDSPVHLVNRLLDNLELSPAYREKTFGADLNTIIGESIHGLYKAAGHQKGESSIFLPVPGSSTPRLPSIPEIALFEFQSQSQEVKEVYNLVVKQFIDEKIKTLRVDEVRAKDLQHDDPAFNEQFYGHFKSLLASNLKEHSLLKRRHKYIAVVKADGDGIGKSITELSLNDENGKKFKSFSTSLMTFSTDAVKSIVDYGGLPIFAGGDDLLFLAPVAVPGKETEHVFALCRYLDALFKQTMEGHAVSMSFGVSISYYKYPLGEAVNRATELEHAAKALLTTGDAPNKNAMSFIVRKHSGQEFGATIRLNGEAFEHLSNLIVLQEEDKDFLTSVMRKLQAFPILLRDAVADPERLKAFRDNHFNEDERHDGPYLDSVVNALPEIYQDYQHLDDQEKLDLLFATLRLKQFLNQSDNE